MTPPRFFVILTVLFSSLAAFFVPRIDASGDEPHYLVMAQSLWREHDLDLRDNYEREDWREFRSGSTTPHYAATRLDGRPFPGHAPGLPFLLAPIYALGGRLACTIFLGVLIAATGALAFWIASAEGLSGAAALTAGTVAAGPPLAAFGLHVYTEALAAFALLAAYALLRFGGKTVTAAFASALACGLPFLHPRMAIGSMAVAFAAFVYRDRSPLRVFVSVAAAGAFIYGMFWMSVFGVPTALGMYGGVPDDAAWNPVQALIGVLLDRAYGLLPYAPVFAVLLFFARFAPPVARGARAFRVELAFVLAVVVPVLLWRVWWGGQSPPARLVAPMVPFLAIWLARSYARAGQGVVRPIMIAAIAWSWALFLFAALQPERLLFINRRVRPTRIWNALWPGGPLDVLLPDMARPLAADWPIAWSWIAVLIVIAVLGQREGSRRRRLALGIAGSDARDASFMSSPRRERDSVAVP